MSSGGSWLRLCLGSFVSCCTTSSSTATLPTAGFQAGRVRAVVPVEAVSKGDVCNFTTCSARDVDTIFHGADCRDCGCEFERWLFGGFKFMIFR